MEIIKSDRISYCHSFVNFHQDKDNLLSFCNRDRTQFIHNDKEYIKEISSLLKKVSERDKYLISRFYVQVDKNELQLFKDKNERSSLNDMVYRQKVDEFSLISFLRFYPFFPKKGIKKYSLSVKNNIFVLEIKNIKNVLLQLRFLSNGNVDYVSLDNDVIREDDNKTYVIKGAFSTSEYLDQSYKIKRLLNILYE